MLSRIPNSLQNPVICKTNIGTAEYLSGEETCVVQESCSLLALRINRELPQKLVPRALANVVKHSVESSDMTLNAVHLNILGECHNNSPDLVVARHC